MVITTGGLLMAGSSVTAVILSSAVGGTVLVYAVLIAQAAWYAGHARVSKDRIDNSGVLRTLTRDHTDNPPEELPDDHGERLTRSVVPGDLAVLGIVLGAVAILALCVCRHRHRGPKDSAEPWRNDRLAAGRRLLRPLRR